MALLRFDTQVYGPGLLAFDVQTYQAPAGLATSQDVFVDLFIIANATQTYTPGIAPGATTQTGASVLAFTANASQVYTPGPLATVQNGAAVITFAANAGQSSALAPESSIVLLAALLDGVAVNPRRRRVLEEKSAAVLTLNFVDGLGVAAAVPDTVTYRVDCLTTGTGVRAAQTLIPASSIALTLTATDNALVNQGNARELRRVTVQATYAGGEAVNAQVDYLVLNLSGVM